MAIRLSQVPAYLLFNFYMQAMGSSGEGGAWNNKWDDVRVGGIADFVLENAAKKLTAAGLVESRISGLLTHFQISDLGIQKIEKMIPDRIFEMYEEEGSGALETAPMADACLPLNKEIDAAITNREASLEKSEPLEQPDNQDGSWEPLKIDRAAPEYKETVSTLEDAITTIRGDNGYAQSEPEERNAIIASLEHGIEIIKNECPTRAQLASLVLSPLRYLAKKFVDTAIGIAAKVAVNAVLTWLGML